MDVEGNDVNESQSLADDPSSMSAKLARMAGAAEAPKGEADLEAARLAQEAEAEAQRVDAEAEAQRVAAEAAAGTETAEEKAAREAAATGDGLTSPEPSETKFTTVEEYDKAYKEAERKMHTATGETKREREAREAAEAEAERLRQENEQLKATQEEKVRAEAAAQSATNLEDKYADALKKISEIKLDRDGEGNIIYPPDYDRQVARAWASTGVDPAQIAQDAARIAKEEIQRDREVETTRVAAQNAATEGERVRKMAENLAQTQYGLDMTPGTADFRLFDTFVAELQDDPKHEMRGKPFEQQVKWASEGVRKLLGEKIELTDAERAAALANQRRNAILERGVTSRTTPEPPKQRSMKDILDGVPAPS